MGIYKSKPVEEVDQYTLDNVDVAEGLLIMEDYFKDTVVCAKFEDFISEDPFLYEDYTIRQIEG